ncbi:MAG TPA: hypothetical protein VN026_17015 [Bacteroidia bacterium]|jgi:hypothetical protein|nr:hypothetical protein [Bacteroidia bacterium]
MRQLINILFFLFLSLGITSQNEGFKIGGTVSDEDEVGMQGVMVTVTKDGKLFNAFPTPYNGTYNLLLPLGAEYVVSITKDGYAKKFFTVSTLGVADDGKKKKFSIMVADLELIKIVPGVDYSVFNKPVIKYLFNQKADNFEYDEVYLNEMLAQVKELKKTKKEAIRLAKTQAYEQEKKNLELAQEKQAQEKRLADEQANAKRLEEEAAYIKKLEEEKAKMNSVATVAPIPTTNEEDTNPSVLSEATLVLKDNTLILYPRSRMLTKALLLKYKIGITEEIIMGDNMVVVQRILVRNHDAWVYHKKIFKWGGIACFRDQLSITESIFENETKTS